MAKVIVPSAGLLQARAAFYRGHAAKLSAELALAMRNSRAEVRCTVAPCRELQAKLLRPIYLRAQVAYTKLVAAQFALQLAEASEAKEPLAMMSKAAEDRAVRRIGEFDKQTRKIAADALLEAQRALEGSAARDRTGSLRARISELRMASRRLILKTTDPLEVYSYFKLPLGAERRPNCNPSPIGSDWTVDYEGLWNTLIEVDRRPLGGLLNSTSARLNIFGFENDSPENSPLL